MIRKILLPTIFLTLAYGFWVSPQFKEIAAGVAIFLFGMLALEEGFKSFTGGTLEAILRRTTNRPWKSLAFGIVSTTLLQSSSLVSVITISFLSAGLIPLVAGIGIIFGANLGTTTGAWLIAGFALKVDIAAYAMPMLVFGIMLVLQKGRQLKGAGYILTGLGFLFLGIHHMTDGFEAFRTAFDLAKLAVPGFRGLLLFTLVGLAATVVMQSSHATLVLTITALAARQITYENAIALAIGANVGTTITAILGAVGANVDGRRLAAAHLFFNLITAGVAIIFIHPLTRTVDTTSAWLGIAPGDHTLKLALFHSIFNALGILLLFPFLRPLVRLLEALLKPTPRPASQPRHLNLAATALPDTAIEAVRLETLRLYDHASAIIARGLSLPLDAILADQPLEDIIPRARKPVQIDIDQDYNEQVKELYAAIVQFISRAQTTMAPEQADELFALRAAGRDIVEAIKDTKHLQKNLSRYLASTNPHIRAEYDAIRTHLASVLRQLHAVRQRGDDSGAILSLDSLKLTMKEHDRALGLRLNSLIRENLISAPMSISLMNDSGYAYHVTKKLVQMAEVLFSTSPLRLRKAERGLSLEDHEVEAILPTPAPRPPDHHHEAP